jgi:hypothetical protein
VVANNILILIQEEILGRGINGGVPCATCTILFSMATQLAEIYNETLIQSLDRFCGYLPVAYEVRQGRQVRQVRQLRQVRQVSPILSSSQWHLAEIYNETLVQSLHRFCRYLPVA